MAGRWKGEGDLLDSPRPSDSARSVVDSVQLRSLLSSGSERVESLKPPSSSTVLELLSSPDEEGEGDSTAIEDEGSILFDSGREEEANR